MFVDGFQERSDLDVIGMSLQLTCCCCCCSGCIILGVVVAAAAAGENMRSCELAIVAGSAVG